MRKKLKILVAVILLVGVMAAYGLHVGWLYVTNDDACLVFALGIAQEIALNGAISDHEVQAMMSECIVGSVVHGRIAADGAVTDLNGNPFEVHRDANQVSVATQWSVWQPFRIKHVVEVESHKKMMRAASQHR